MDQFLLWIVSDPDLIFMNYWNMNLDSGVSATVSVHRTHFNFPGQTQANAENLVELSQALN